MFRCLLNAVLLATFASAQSESPPVPQAPSEAPKVQSPAVEVPTFANPTCPIMGKKVSMPLFIDTEVGRFYVCCKPCYKKIRANVEAAHKTAYPVQKQLENKVCPISGEPIGEDAETVTLQGFTFRVCCSGCIETARTHSQVTLTKLTRDKLIDVGNLTCPVSGEAVEANAFVLIGDALVHLSSAEHADAVAKDPVAMLAKARAIAKAQKPAPKHQHTPKTKTPDEPVPPKKGDGK